MKTPTNRKSHGDGVEQTKSSGKKLVQARLPFKILTTPSSATAEGVVTAKDIKETSKRKLLCDDDDDDATSLPKSTKRRSLRNGGNEANTKKRKEIINGSAAKKAVIANVVLSDSNDSDNGGIDHNTTNESRSKANLKTREKPNPSTMVGESSDVLSDDVELIESTDEGETKVDGKSKTKKTTKKVIETIPLSNKKLTPTSTKSRKSVTPQNNKKSTGKGRKSAGDANSESKLQIKFPMSSKKNKRKKQATKTSETVDNDDMHNELSDDIEIISKELHPEKRPKLDVNSDSENHVNEVRVLKIKADDKEEKTKNAISGIVKEQSKKSEEKVEKAITKPMEILDEPNSEGKETSTTPKNTTEEQLESEDAASESEQNKSKVNEVSSATTDLESDTTKPEIEETCTKEIKAVENIGSPIISSDSNINKIQKKNLTPKQQKLLEQRLKAREEKERKIQEERLQKQRDKEERELAKKREREEREEQRRKEREEKEDQRRKEREEKERKRLADIEVKNEEKRKRTEAKEEEQRKKEEERKRKEQEKEEAEIKKKKAALAFTKFFSRPAQETTDQRTGEKNVTEENHELLAFRPFQIKGDMKLAPIVRKKLTAEEREQLATFIEEENSTKSYLDELKSGKIKPYQWTPTDQNENEPIDPKQLKGDTDDNVEDNGEDDVIIVEDELERAGQAIVEEHNVPIERFRAKFYKFAENRRPPFFGTWRKKSKIITPRRPFAQDKQFFDYEVDSDDEWEEEEPGESLDGSDDDKEKESEDDDYEVDNEWFVPHGHLSEEEMQNEDDLGENNDREAQKAKLQILQQEFAQEMKKKTEKIKPRLIGCIWVDENGNQPELCPKIIWNTLNMRAILCAEPPIMEEIKSIAEKNGEINTANAQTGEKSNSETKLKPITLTESMLQQLVKLVHGNSHSKNFLIKEFIAYIESTEESVRNGDVCVPLKSAVREKIDEFAQWQVVERLSKNNKITKDNNKSTKVQKNKKRLCWVVSNDILQKMNLEAIDLNNAWKYILTPRVSQKEETAPIKIDNNEDSNEQIGTSEASGNANDRAKPIHNKNKNKRNPDIKKFTRVLTTEEKAQQLQNTPRTKETTMASPTTTKSTTKNNIDKSSSGNQTPTVKKRVPLLISVARGQSISTPDKNARISQFLKTINDEKQKEKQDKLSSTTPMETDTDDVVVLD